MSDLFADAGRRRARGRLVAIAVLVAVVVGLLVWSAVVAPQQRPPTPTAQRPATPTTADPRASRPTSPPDREYAAAEDALARQPMMYFPLVATQPHALATENPAGVLALPNPRAVLGRLIPGGFEGTPAGAVAQLVELTQAGIAGGDPQAYAAGYQSIAEPGAPPATRSSLWRLLTAFRAEAGLAPGSGVPGLTVRFEATHGLVKGTTAQGRYVVACVLGELWVSREGRDLQEGVGDCQAMHYSPATGWQIAAGTQAAPAPDAWPGSQECVAAGYLPLTGAMLAPASGTGSGDGTGGRAGTGSGTGLDTSPGGLGNASPGEHGTRRAGDHGGALAVGSEPVPAHELAPWTTRAAAPGISVGGAESRHGGRFGGGGG